MQQRPNIIKSFIHSLLQNILNGSCNYFTILLYEEIVKVEKSSAEILREIRRHVQNGTYIVREHAIERQKERKIKLPDVLYVLNFGKHEKDKDLFDIKNQRWKHAIRGKTTLGDDLRVIVAFHERLAIINVIRL